MAVFMIHGVLMRSVRVTAINASFGLKWSLEFRQLRAGADQHLLDRMIRAYAEDRGPDLRWYMAVAELPGKPRKLLRVVMVRLHNRLRRRVHGDPASVSEAQAIAAGHDHGVRQIEQNSLAMIRSQPDAVADARLEIERDAAFGLRFWPKPLRTVDKRAMHREGS